MLGLLDFLGWAVAIASFILGIICWIGMFIDTNGWIKFIGVITIIIGIVVFWRVYVWMESVGVCLFATGFLLGMIGAGANSNTTADKGSSPRYTEKEYTVTNAILDTYCEYELMKEAAKSAIRESKE